LSVFNHPAKRKKRGGERDTRLPRLEDCARGQNATNLKGSMNRVAQAVPLEEERKFDEAGRTTGEEPKWQ